MAQKKITDLVLRDNCEDTVNFPGDDGIQTYRVTALQIKDYILANEAILRAMITPAERIPIGSIQAYAAETAPTGWLLCDGAAVSRATYSALFSVVGTSFGQGDGSTTFNTPNFKGRFLRGWADGSTVDPDRASRTAMATGGATGDNIGSVQGHAFQTHTHTQNAHTHTQNSHTHTDSTTGGSSDNLNTPRGGLNNNVGTMTTNSTTATNQNTTATNQNAAASGATSQTSTNETRPVNAYVNYIIKF